MKIVRSVHTEAGSCHVKTKFHLIKKVRMSFYQSATCLKFLRKQISSSNQNFFEQRLFIRYFSSIYVVVLAWGENGNSILEIANKTYVK